MARFYFYWGNEVSEPYKVGTICSIRFIDSNANVYEQHNLIIDNLRQGITKDTITARMTDEWAEGGKCIVTIRKKKGKVAGAEKLDYTGLSKDQWTEMSLNLVAKEGAAEGGKVDYKFLRDFRFSIQPA